MLTKVGGRGTNFAPTQNRRKYANSYSNLMSRLFDFFLFPGELEFK